MEKGDSAYHRAIVLKIPVPMKLHKPVEQRVDIIGGHRPVGLPGKQNRVPGAADQGSRGRKRAQRTQRVCPCMADILLLFKGLFLLPCLRSLCRRCVRPVLVKPQKMRQGFLHFLPLYDLIYKSMLQKKFRSLEALGKLLADGLLDHSGARETD